MGLHGQEFMRVTLPCSACGAKSRGYFVDVNTQPLSNPLPHHCLGCGAPCPAVIDEEQNYWDLMAECMTVEYRRDGLIPADSWVNPALLHTLFDLWQPLRQHTYGTFVRRALTEPDFLDEVITA